MPRLALLVLAPGIAVAGFGDHRAITGQITLWGPNRFGQQIAVVQDDEGQPWVVRFDPGTLPPRRSGRDRGHHRGT